MAGKKGRKTAQEVMRQGITEGKEQRDVEVLEQLMANLQELNPWQYNLIQEAARRVKSMAGK